MVGEKGCRENGGKWSVIGKNGRKENEKKKKVKNEF